MPRQQPTTLSCLCFALVALGCICAILLGSGLATPLLAADHETAAGASMPLDTCQSLTPLRRAPCQLTLAPENNTPFVGALAKRIQALFATLPLQQYASPSSGAVGSLQVKGRYRFDTLNPLAHLSVCFDRTELLLAISHPPTNA